MTQMKVQRREF